MRALTLQRPWVAAYMLPVDPKRFDNRSYLPPATAIGETIALHSGQGYWVDLQRQPYGLLTTAAEREQWLSTGDTVGVFATVRLVGWVRPHRHLERLDDGRHYYMSPRSDGTSSDVLAARVVHSRWWLGPVAWVFEDYRQLSEPIQCRGAQRLWNLPPHIAAQVEEQSKGVTDEP